MKTALTIAIVIVGLVIVVSILMQPSKSDALSGLIQGSNNRKGGSREQEIAEISRSLIKQEQKKLCLKE